MINPRRILYAAGPVGIAFELYETREYNPDPIGIASWMAANSAAMYAATSYANHASVGGQTVFSVYGPVLKEEAANLARIIRGPKPPPGPLTALAVGGIFFNVIVPDVQNMFGLNQVEYA